MTTLTLQAASARRHPRVPRNNERKIVWVLAERPLTDRGGRFLRVVIDADGSVCWPKWRRVYCDSVELMSPEQYPPRMVDVPDLPRTACAKCGRTFRLSSGCKNHERVCGRELPNTLASRQSESMPGRSYWWRRGMRKFPADIVEAVRLAPGVHHEIGKRFGMSRPQVWRIKSGHYST